MAKMEELGGVAQAEIIVIPIIDVSGSMCGEKIGMVNEAMAEVPDQLAAINKSILESKLLIAPMEFSNGARWFALSNNQPAEVESFRWIDMQAGGITDLGAAFKLLTEKLTTKEKGGWMEGRGGMAPVLILLSDGGPTDDYQKPLAELKKRGWFKAASKFAIAVGEDADKAVLAEFTGNLEAVIDTEVIRKDLASIIKIVMVSASKAQSEASISNTGNAGNTAAVVSDSGPEVDQRIQDEIVETVKKDLNMDNTDDLF